MPTKQDRAGAALAHALAHHARELEPLVGALATGIVTRLVPHGWELSSIKGGPGSYMLYKNGGPRGYRECHFRPGLGAGGKYDHILVFDSWVRKNKKPSWVLDTRVSVLRFVEMLEKL